MRDIRSDLRERLDGAQKAKSELDAEFKAALREVEARFRQKTAAVDGEIAVIRSLLDIEMRRSGGDATYASVPSLPIQEFFVSVVRESGPKTKPELRDLADEAGYFQSGENPGRTTHGHVQSLWRQGIFLRDGEKFSLPPETAGQETGLFKNQESVP